MKILSALPFRKQFQIKTGKLNEKIFIKIHYMCLRQSLDIRDQTVSGTYNEKQKQKQNNDTCSSFEVYDSCI